MLVSGLYNQRILLNATIENRINSHVLVESFAFLSAIECHRVDDNFWVFKELAVKYNFCARVLFSLRCDSNF